VIINDKMAQGPVLDLDLSVLIIISYATAEMNAIHLNPCVMKNSSQKILVDAWIFQMKILTSAIQYGTQQKVL